MNEKDQQVTRREVIKKAAFVAPVILTLPAGASFASAGSSHSGRGHASHGWHHHHRHYRHRKDDD
jgi:hypothetical protein